MPEGELHSDAIMAVMEKIKDLKTLVAFGTTNRKSQTELYRLLERYYSMLPPNPDPMRDRAQELISSLKRVENVYQLYHEDAEQVHLRDKIPIVGSLEAYTYTYHVTLRDHDEKPHRPITLKGVYIATQQHFHDTETYDIIEEQPHNMFWLFLRDLINVKDPLIIDKHGLPGVDADDRELDIGVWNPRDRVDFMILIADKPRPIHLPLQDKLAFRIYFDPNTPAGPIPATWL
jgi:hypothetical protein